MTERQARQAQQARRWSRWLPAGRMAIALFAALSLAFTVLLAQRALDKAADVVIRGDGDRLLEDVFAGLWNSESLDHERGPARLEEIVARNAAGGLRYIGLVDRESAVTILSGGTPTITAPVSLGGVTRRGARVRIAAIIFPRTQTHARAGQGPPELNVTMRPYVVIEFEPPLIATLQQDLRVIALVAAAPAAALVLFALALSRSTARLAAIREQAERESRLVALGRASAVMAHELRNPIAALKGHAQLLAEDLPEPARARADRVVAGAVRLEQLTSTLLDFVRDGALELREVTPAELVERALGELPGSRVQVDLSRAPARLHVDLERTALALRNIIQNAVQANPDDAAPVDVRIAGAGTDEAAIEVRDHGAGLAHGAEAQIFEPFMTTKVRGTGLGLVIARRIAEQHLGRLTGQTHAQGGALFRLVLPLDKSARVS
jgi:two-component system sensor histidine kinase HydH